MGRNTPHNQLLTRQLKSTSSPRTGSHPEGPAAAAQRACTIRLPGDGTYVAEEAECKSDDVGNAAEQAGIAVRSGLPRQWRQLRVSSMDCFIRAPNQEKPRHHHLSWRRYHLRSGVTRRCGWRQVAVDCVD